MNRPALRGRFLSRTMTLAAVFVVASGFFHVPKAHASFSETLTSADVGTSFTVDWYLPPGTYEENNNGTTGTNTLTLPLSALGTFTVDSLSSRSLVLSATIDNTTVLTSGLTQSYLMSVGISSNPTGNASIKKGGSVFNAVRPGHGKNETFPGGFKNINACIFDSGGGCAGQDINDGLGAGSSDSFDLALSGSFGNTPSITLSDFAVKFQTNEGSYEFGGNALSETPEPGTLALFGTALLLAVGTFLRRRLLPASQEVLRE